MDWQVIGSVASAIAAIAALITAVIMAFQIRLIRNSVSIDVLLRLDAHFNSADMRSIRRKAASYLMRRNFNPHLVLPDDEKRCQVALDDLLDFFESLAFLVRKRGTPGLGDIWCFFFGYIDYYCHAAKEYIEQAREEDELQWRELTEFHQQLIAVERRYSRKYESPDDDQLHRFLEDEIGLTI